MNAKVNFYACPLVDDVRKKTAKNGSTYLSLKIKYQDNVLTISCYEDSPVFPKISNMRLKKGSIINALCNMTMVKKEAIRPEVWRPMIRLLKTVPIADRVLKNFVNSCTESSQMQYAGSYFKLIDMDYAIPSEYLSKNQHHNQTTQKPAAPAIPQEPLTLDGFCAG